METFHAAWWTIGGGIGDAREKWDPVTRETADHSMPYIVASVLLDGHIGPDSFDPDKLRESERRWLMQRTTVLEIKEFSNAVSAGQYPSRIRVKLTDGREFVESFPVPKGNYLMPMSDDDVSAKFDGLTSDVLEDDARDQFRDRLWELDRSEDVGDVTSYFRMFRRQ